MYVLTTVPFLLAEATTGRKSLDVKKPWSIVKPSKILALLAWGRPGVTNKQKHKLNGARQWCKAIIWKAFQAGPLPIPMKTALYPSSFREVRLIPLTPRPFSHTTWCVCTYTSSFNKWWSPFRIFKWGAIEFKHPIPLLPSPSSGLFQTGQPQREAGTEGFPRCCREANTYTYTHSFQTLSLNELMSLVGLFLLCFYWLIKLCFFVLHILALLCIY